jgi:hypothetical protein
MQKASYMAALMMLCGGMLLAQHGASGGNNAAVDPAKFWQGPDQTDRDSKGNITYTEIKDAKSFTKRVFLNGQWATYHYRPGTVEITSIENSDSTEDLLYNTERNVAGVTVRSGGKSHTLRYDRSKGTVAADGLPTITVEHDPSSLSTRDLKVRSGKEVVASVVYGPTGEVASVNVGAMTLSLTPTDNGMKETLAANGVPLKEATATFVVKRTFSVFLDPVADRLHLGKDWANETRSRSTQTGYLSSIQQGANIIATVVRLGEMQASFASDGTPLLYDITVDYDAGEPQRNDYRVAALYAATLPTHIIITSDGEVGAYVQTPGSGSIRAFWTSHSDGHTLYNYSVYDAGVKSSGSAAGYPVNATSPALAASRMLAVPRRVITPTAMVMCDASLICTDGGTGCPSCGGCSTTYYYCDTGGGGVGYTPPYDGGSGGTPTGGGNQIFDPTLRITVNRAISAANTKLATVQCGVALLMNAKWDNTSALNELTLRGGAAMSANDWFASISWRDGAGIKNPATGRDKCESACAFTTPGDTTDYVCTSFERRAFQANTLVHEMLHTLGMPECNGISCPNPTAMSPAAIDDLVAQYCGAN